MAAYSGRGASLALACLVLWIVTCCGLPSAKAQSVAVDGRNSGETPVADSVPNSVMGDPAGIDALANPDHVASGVFDVIVESIFGAASAEEWTPLDLGTFFSDGWDRPWVWSPEGTNGAPKQNWFGASDGVFVRLNSVNFFFTDGMTKNTGLLLDPFPWSPVKPMTNGNQYWASYNLYLPLNQRLELVFVAPFIASNKTSSTGHYVANFGDLTISGRFRLIEHRNFSFQALLTERTPTGQTINGNNINFVTPAVEFWSNFAPGWVLRGGTGLNIDTGRPSATDTYFTNLAMGRYLTTADARIFKQMVAHVAVSTMSDVLGRKDHISDVYVSPGLRFSLGPERKWAILSALQVPVAGPHPYAYQADFALVREF